MSTRRHSREGADSTPATHCPSHSGPREVTPNRGDNVAGLGRGIPQRVGRNYGGAIWSDKRRSRRE
jgi:hypothetical protein